MHLPLPNGSVPHIKVCGLTRVGDARLALQLGASYLGLIFAEASPRRITEAPARELLAALRAEAPAPVRAFGVFVHEPWDEIRRLAEELDLAAVQLHGAYPTDEQARDFPRPIVRAVRVRGPEDHSAIEAALERGPVLLDTHRPGKHGGTGEVFDHALARPHFPQGQVLLAGGLKPANVASIVRALQQPEGEAMPYALDVSSGLEREPGVKDEQLLRLFFANFRAAAEELFSESED